ncbi:hypothetical protein ACLGI4_14645 [Streptomyces sp. HMX112]|uniref:hypothetical protein n=1 Tax=Streptomyces sp. HMX112 TaxID=3390850 RepID=UPI003A811ECE
MHMNSAPHLLAEDRAAYERLVDEALRTAHDRPDPTGPGQRLNTEQLRTMALNASALITAAAAAEYDHYVRVREEARAPVGRSGPASGPAAMEDEPEEGTGAGLGAMITVLAPVLAGTSAVTLLLVGSVLKMLDPPPSFADPLLTAGWFFAAVTVAGLLAAGTGLLLTALRNRPTQLSAEEPGGEPADEVSRAREAWRQALLERGLLPFLREALAGPVTEPVSATPPRAAGRIPKVGYSGPDFSSPNEGGRSPRPTYSSPDFSSPDFGGPGHRPD